MCMLQACTNRWFVSKNLVLINFCRLVCHFASIPVHLYQAGEYVNIFSVGSMRANGV
jgi:hypothetical protein